MEAKPCDMFGHIIAYAEKAPKGFKFKVVSHNYTESELRGILKEVRSRLKSWDYRHQHTWNEESFIGIEYTS